MTNLYRRTKIGIPQKVRQHFPNNDTLRLGDSYCADHGFGGYKGCINVYLVPKNGGGFYKQIATLERKFEKPEQFAEEVKRIAKDEELLTRILLEHLGIIQQGIMQQHVQ